MSKHHGEMLILHTSKSFLFLSACSLGGICSFLPLKRCPCKGLCSKPRCSYLHPEPRIRQDRAFCLKPAFFRQLGSLFISYSDLEMKREGTWQRCVLAFPTEKIFEAVLPLLLCQSVLSLCCCLLSVSLQLLLVVILMPARDADVCTDSLDCSGLPAACRADAKTSCGGLSRNPCPCFSDAACLPVDRRRLHYPGAPPQLISGAAVFADH